jgi:hypothetical protein
MGPLTLSSTPDTTPLPVRAPQPALQVGRGRAPGNPGRGRGHGGEPPVPARTGADSGVDIASLLAAARSNLGGNEPTPDAEVQVL